MKRKVSSMQALSCLYSPYSESRKVSALLVPSQSNCSRYSMTWNSMSVGHAVCARCPDPIRDNDVSDTVNHREKVLKKKKAFQLPKNRDHSNLLQEAKIQFHIFRLHKKYARRIHLPYLAFQVKIRKVRKIKFQRVLAHRLWLLLCASFTRTSFICQSRPIIYIYNAFSEDR